MGKSSPVAIIGAGISGLGCAHALRAAGLEVHVFERAPRVGGRCATRLWQGHLVDYGAQFFTARTPEFKRELLTRLRQFRPIIPPILDDEGKMVPSVGGPRFYVLQGNNYFAQVLSHSLDVRLNTTVETVAFLDDGVEILGFKYAAVVSSLPAPQTARLFALAESPADYDGCLSALLEYSGLLVGDSANCYAHLHRNDSGPVQVSYCENHKSGRIVGDKTVFIVEAGARFSLENADQPPDDYVPALVLAHEALWKIPAGKCTAAFGHGWSLARPRDDSRRKVVLPPGAFLCGDSRAESLVEEVWLDGRHAAAEVIAYLALKPPAA